MRKWVFPAAATNCPRILLCAAFVAIASMSMPVLAQTEGALQPSPLGPRVSPTVNTPNYKTGWGDQTSKKNHHRASNQNSGTANNASIAQRP
jgi:hypothetical protein